jgi:hypothetical protein
MLSMEEAEERGTTEAEDAATESAVLLRILDLHPAQLTLAELVRDVGGEGAGFRERDAIERAVRELTGAGLLHRQGEFVLPTRAALRFNQLADR